ncbi:hypothetical protein Barb7_01334 [Bacteroidales bacterium Barb7]|nr:hypothetical protein Barb7_01334 [Bacteroidales bacterium Barb7]
MAKAGSIAMGNLHNLFCDFLLRCVWVTPPAVYSRQYTIYMVFYRLFNGTTFVTY